MMTTIETYVRTGSRNLRKWARNPKFRLTAKFTACFLGGLALSAASLAHTALPLTLGLICAMTGWRAVATAAGGALGYLLFWGPAGYQGMVWSGCGLAAALGLGKRRILDESPLLMVAVAGLIVSATGLGFQIFLEDSTTVPRYLLRVLLGALSPKLFELVRERRDRWADWLALGCGVLALSQVAPLGFSLGYVAAGAIGAWAPLPAAALAGLALDLSQVTRTSMTAVLCLGYLARNIPLPQKWIRWGTPGAVYLLVMHLSGNGEYLPFFGLLLGGVTTLWLPEPELPVHRRGRTDIARIRMELMAECLGQTRRLLLEEEGIPIDEEALLQRTRERACGSCPNRKSCRRQPLPRELLHSPLVETASLSVPCKKPGRMISELRRAQEQFRFLRADRERQREYRAAVTQQYRFLEEFLQQQADLLPQTAQRLRQRYNPSVTVRTAGREETSGDRCVSFSGPGCRHFVLLCDGMGTGPEAARESQTAIELLRQMLTAGFPAEYALSSVNSLLVLRGRAAAVTMDLAELHLDSGRATVYKWGAAASWLLRGGGAEKIGTATPPPGLSVSEGREMAERLSLRRGEVLILVSDGVEVEGALRRDGGIQALPPGEVAAKLLEWGAREREDDATVAVVTLRPGAMAPS